MLGRKNGEIPIKIAINQAPPSVKYIRTLLRTKIICFFFGFSNQMNLDGTEMGELLQEIGRLSLKIMLKILNFTFLKLTPTLAG